MSEVTTLFGKTLDYWLELGRRYEAEEGRSAALLLEEVVKLRGRLSFYESRIKEMASVSEAE